MQQIPIGERDRQRGTFDLNGSGRTSTPLRTGGAINLNAGTLVINRARWPPTPGTSPGPATSPSRAPHADPSGVNTQTANLFVNGGTVRAGSNTASARRHRADENAAGATSM